MATYRAAAVRALVHRINGHEHRRVADRRGRHRADRGLGVAVVVHVGVVARKRAAFSVAR
jgi:hypothetical protein